MKDGSLARECVAEMIGTYILVFFGVGVVHAAVLTGAHVGLWHVAVVWAVGISLAIYATGAVSGGHINPAITVAFSVFRGFPRRKILPYVFSQLVGAILGAATLHGLFHRLIRRFERVNDIIRGTVGSELSAMVYGEYFPNPSIVGIACQASEAITPLQAMCAEGIGTAFLVFFVFAVTDQRNEGRPEGTLPAPFIGLAAGIVISVLAPLTQAGLNPARDFGPRLLAYFLGWGSVAIPGPRGGFFTVYILGPILGGLVGAFVYQKVLKGKMLGGETRASD